MADPISVLFKRNPDRRVSIGSIMLDATVEESHDFRGKLTDHPIEDGGFASDHFYLEPNRLSISGEITDSPVQFFSALGGVTNRRIEAYEQMKELLRKGDVLTVVTGLEIYSDMVMTSFIVPRNQQTGRRLQFRAEFKQAKFVSSQIVGIAEEKAAPEQKDAVASNKSVGTQETPEPNSEIEKKAAEQGGSYLFGGARGVANVIAPIGGQ